MATTVFLMCLCGEPGGRHAVDCPRPETRTQDEFVEAWLHEALVLKRQHAQASIDQLQESTVREVRAVLMSAAESPLSDAVLAFAEGRS